MASALTHVEDKNAMRAASAILQTAPMRSQTCSLIPASSLKVLHQIILGMADVNANASAPPCCLQQDWVPHLDRAITSGVNCRQHWQVQKNWNTQASCMKVEKCRPDAAQTRFASNK